MKQLKTLTAGAALFSLSLTTANADVATTREDAVQRGQNSLTVTPKQTTSNDIRDVPTAILYIQDISGSRWDMAEQTLPDIYAFRNEFSQDDDHIFKLGFYYTGSAGDVPRRFENWRDFGPSGFEQAISDFKEEFGQNKQVIVIFEHDLEDWNWSDDPNGEYGANTLFTRLAQKHGVKFFIVTEATEKVLNKGLDNDYVKYGGLKQRDDLIKDYLKANTTATTTSPVTVTIGDESGKLQVKTATATVDGKEVALTVTNGKVNQTLNPKTNQAVTVNYTFEGNFNNGDSGTMTARLSNGTDTVDKSDTASRRDIVRDVVETRQDLPFKTIYQADDTKTAGEKTTVTPGQAGSVVSRQNTEDGKPVGQPDVKRTEATNAVVKVGTKPLVTSVDIPFTTRYEADKSLEAGQIRVAVEGKVGQTITTVSYTLNTETGEVSTSQPDVKTVKPQERVIKVGIYSPVATEHLTYETIYRTDENLPVGESYVEREGRNGTRETRVIHDMDENGQLINPRTVVVGGKDAVNRIVRLGKKPLVSETTITPEMTYVADDTLNLNEKVVEKEGEEGLESSRTTYTAQGVHTDGKTITLIDEDDTITPNDPIVTKKDAVSGVTRVGTKPTEQVTELPFDVVYVADDKLEKGQTVVEQEGKVGQAIKTTTYRIENGKAVPDKETTKVIDPVHKRVKVGTKSEVTVEAIPFTTRFEADETLPYGHRDVVTTGKEGSITRTRSYTLDAKSGEVTAKDAEVVVDPVEHLVKVGTKPTVVETTKDLGYIGTYDKQLGNGVEIVDDKGQPRLIRLITRYTLDTKTGQVSETTTKEVIEGRPKRYRFGLDEGYDALALGDLSGADWSAKANDLKVELEAMVEDRSNALFAKPSLTLSPDEKRELEKDLLANDTFVTKLESLYDTIPNRLTTEPTAKKTEEKEQMPSEIEPKVEVSKGDVKEAKETSEPKPQVDGVVKKAEETKQTSKKAPQVAVEAETKQVDAKSPEKTDTKTVQSTDATFTKSTSVLDKISDKTSTEKSESPKELPKTGDMTSVLGLLGTLPLISGVALSVKNRKKP